MSILYGTGDGSKMGEPRLIPDALCIVDRGNG